MSFRSLKDLPKSSIILIIGIVFLSFNLRPGITGVGPVIDKMQSDLGFSYTFAGFITTLPIIAFAFTSLFASDISRVAGLERTIFGGLILILTGTGIRVINQELLVLGTIFMGAGIAICNVLLIPLIKNRLAEVAAWMTSIYTLGMSVFAALGSGLSVPLSNSFSMGWQSSLAAWCILCIIGCVVWIPQLKLKTVRSSIADKEHSVNIWKSKRAWAITLFMGVQSLIFFSLISWLPQIIQSKGFSEDVSGYYVFFMQIFSLPSVYFVPLWATSSRRAWRLILGMGLAYFISFSLMYSGNLYVLYAGAFIISISLGGSISLAYYLINVQTDHPVNSAKLSGLAQSIGYFVAASGPFIIGSLYDIFQVWNYVLIVFFVATCLYLVFGFYSTRESTVEEQFLS